MSFYNLYKVFTIDIHTVVASNGHPQPSHGDMTVSVSHAQASIATACAGSSGSGIHGGSGMVAIAMARPQSPPAYNSSGSEADVGGGGGGAVGGGASSSSTASQVPSSTTAMRRMHFKSGRNSRTQQQQQRGPAVPKVYNNCSESMTFVVLLKREFNL